MGIPIRLSPGQLSIYGAGSSVSQNNIIAPTGFSFGVIDKIWDNGINGNQVGDSIMFQEQDVLTRLVYSNWIYTIIPQNKIGLTEEPPV